MTRVARPLTILVLILGLTLATMVPTASAGSLNGGSAAVVLFLIGAPVGTCAYMVDNDPASAFFGHSWLGIKTGNGGINGEIKLVGPLQGVDGIAAVLPGGLSSGCFQVAA
jgi:hypothetical protein